MSLLVGVDVGGSGLRCQAVSDGVPGEVWAAPGAQIGVRGLDLGALVASVVAFLPSAPDVLVWSTRGLSLADPGALTTMIAEQIRPRTVAVCSDAVGALVGAVGAIRPGAVVAAGTGVVAFATDFDQVWRRVDAWGHVLGDRGSSAWVGLRALETALLAYDGVDSSGAALLEAATARLGTPEDWPRIVMTRTDAVAVLAGLAPDVTRLAATDAAAARICADAGRELARSLATASAGLEGVCVTRTGGLFAAAPIREAFDAAAVDLRLDVQPPVGSGLDGALCLASHLAAGLPLATHPEFLVVTT